MKGPLSFVMSLIVAVLLGCVTPTGGCACSPPPVAVTITGIVLDATGVPVPAATVTVGRGAPDSCELIRSAEQRTVVARADGTFALSEFLEGGQECRRLQAFPPTGSPLGPSGVELVRFAFDNRQPQSVSLRLLAAP